MLTGTMGWGSPLVHSQEGETARCSQLLQGDGPTAEPAVRARTLATADVACLRIMRTTMTSSRSSTCGDGYFAGD